MSYFSDASLVFIPSAQKSGKAYSVKPTDGTGDLTFTRSNDTATRVGPTGLIEKVRTNLLTYSNTFNNAAWANSNITLTSGQQDPFGGTTGWRYLMTSVGNSYLYQNSITINGAEMTLSFWVKSNTGSSQTFIATANSGSQSSPTFTATTSWQRFSWTFTSNGGNSNILLAYNASTNCDLLIYGAQFETGVMTDYIPTTTAAVSVGPVANVPRLDYLNSSCPRLLLEPQRTNLAVYSEQLDNANYTKSLVTVTPNNATSPDGYQNADTLTASAGTGIPQAYSAFSATAGAYTYSFFVKAGTHKNVFFASYSSNAFGPSFVYRDMIFNTDSGTVTASAGNLTVSTNVQNYTNGWYRVSVTYTATASGTIVFIVALAANSTTVSGTWTGSENIQVYGMQVEAGAYATSYIPTLGAAVTRGADAASKTSATALIGQTEGTLFAEFTIQRTPTSTDRVAILNDGTSNERIGISIGGGGLLYMFVVDGNATQAEIIRSGTTAGTYKVAAAYKANDFVFYVNGVQVGTDTAGTIPSCSRLDVGNQLNTGELGGGVSQTILFKTRLPNSSLAELTTL